MNPIQYTTDQSQKIQELQQYVNEYCQTHGVNPEIYTQYLDGQKTIDPKLLKDPAFQAYWQLAYLQLMEVINPTLVQSLQGEVGDVDFDVLFARAGDDMNAFVENLISDNPEFLSFSALVKGNPALTEEAIRQAFVEAQQEQTKPYAFVDENARALAEKYKLSGTWDWLIGTEEGIRSTQNWLLASLAEMDQQLFNLEGALKDGSLTVEQYQARVGVHSQNRQVVLSLMQNLEGAMQQMMELFSQLVQTNNESQLAISRNWNVNA